MVLNKLQGQHRVEVKVHSGIRTDWVRPLALPSQLCKRHLPVAQLLHYIDEEQDLPYMLIVIIKGDNV